ncbi:hypothetical protein [Ekhidna sp.]|jgi:hypothetical protein|uniref:hypothetical protein n=1 Tax=Ekhidna sp. TaxID=2608089 RepID=UPI0032ED1CA6
MKKKVEKYVVGIFIILLSASNLSAQIKFDVNVSDKHLKKVEKSKDAGSKLKAYKQAYSKDSIKAAKKAWKTYKQDHKDSLKSIGKWKEVKTHKKEFILGKYNFKKPKEYAIDYSQFDPPEDSVDWALQELSKRGDFEQVQKIYEAYGQYDSAYLNQFILDSMQLDSAMLADRFQIKERLESYLPEGLRQESDFKVSEQMKHGAVDEFGNIKHIDRSGVSEFFKNISQEEFTKSQLSLNAAKEKYAVIPDLSKEDEGIKRKSLKGSPLKEKIFLNGSVTIQSTAPVILDMNIQLGYKWKKSLSTGLGLMLREQLNNKDSTSLTGDAHGFSLFANYDIAKEFFLYSEYQLVKNKSLFQESVLPASWQYAALAGVGRRFNISRKLSLSVLVLYDFNYKNNTLNYRPLTPRIGYQMYL